MKNLLPILLVACLLMSALLFGSSTYIYAKAALAQLLIQHAWQQAVETGSNHPPWSWADTHPVAKLTLGPNSFYVLSGVSGHTLAFGPGHMSSTPLPGIAGNVVIAGHRDTHFSQLNKLNINDNISLETTKDVYQYRIVDRLIVHENNMLVAEQTDENVLTLITCYPFDAISPNTPWRYVIKAIML